MRGAGAARMRRTYVGKGMGVFIHCISVVIRSMLAGVKRLVVIWWQIIIRSLFSKQLDYATESVKYIEKENKRKRK